VREVDPWDLVETLRESLLALDSDLTIRFASGSLCDTFAVAPEDAVGRKLYELGNRQWDIPDGPIPGLAAGWWIPVRDSSAARSRGRAATREPSCLRHCLHVKPRTIYAREGDPSR
jgi:hypothetical protein